MAIITTEHIQAYLTEHGLSFSSVTQLCGGSTNYLWRVQSPLTQETTIIKHAEPYLAGNTAVHFPVDRMAYEVRALTLLSDVIGGTVKSTVKEDTVDKVVHLPEIVYHNEQDRILQLVDAGSHCLHDLYTDPRLDVKFIGWQLGRWLADLHMSSTDDQIRCVFDHSVAKSMYRWNFNNLASILEFYGHESELGDRINTKYGALIATDDECVCHGDLWPGNILLTGFQGSGHQNVAQRPQLTIIDWEVARNGNGMTDVGHFAGEEWLLDSFRGGRGLQDAFLDGYVKRKGPLDIEKRWRVAAQFATHITHWPTIYGWVNPEETRQCVQSGAGFLSMVDQMDAVWLETGPLRAMFPSADVQCCSSSI